MIVHSGIQVLVTRHVDVNPLLRRFIHYGRIFKSIVLQNMVVETEILCELDILFGCEANNLPRRTTIVQSGIPLTDEVCQAEGCFG